MKASDFAPLDPSNLEDRKKEEIEHSRNRRTILQGYERRIDTHSSEEVADRDRLIRDKVAFEHHFANVKYYSITGASQEYQDNWLRERCKAGMQVLDFACGNGENGIFAAQCGASVIGIDISPEGVANANKNALEARVADHCEFVAMDGENMKFPDSSFDLAVEYGALHHVDLKAAMKELGRVLKPGGEMLCIEAIRHNPFFHAYRRLTPHLRTKWEVDHILSVKDLDIMRQYFHHVDVKFFHMLVLAAVPFRKTFLFPRLKKFLDSLDRSLLSGQGIGKYGWIMAVSLKDPIKRAA
jgi:ubiquinone/menaquinone biosynthesis C-methylase UbiE